MELFSKLLGWGNFPAEGGTLEVGNHFYPFFHELCWKISMYFPRTFPRLFGLQSLQKVDGEESIPG